MENYLILYKILDLYKKTNIKSFPLDCYDLINKLNIELYKYSELSERKLIKCKMISEEAFKLHNAIYYNDEKANTRIHFSLMHELGHIVLKHGESRLKNEEQEANYFASHILAPRMAIHYSGCRNHVDVAKLFNISYEAAQYSFDDYRCWHRKVIHKMSTLDKLIYTHFYNDEFNGFVYSIRQCKLCGKEILNSNTSYCEECFNKLSYINYYQDDKYFHAAENSWLYGGL